MVPNPLNSQNSRSTVGVNDGNGFSRQRFLADVLQTRECRQALDTVISTLLLQWSAENTAKKKIAHLLGRFINRKLSKSSDVLMEKELVGLFEKPEFVENAGLQVPELLNRVIEILHATIKSLENLPQDKKSEIVGNVLSEIDTAKMAGIFMSLTQTTGSLRKSDPLFFSEKILPQIQNWLNHTDFGEFRENFDNSKEDYNTLITKICELAFEYPAKFIILLSFIPGIANFVLLFLADMTERFTTLSPDMLADILLSFFREMDGNIAGKLVNNLTEVVRQLHTGSALVGESGAPRFTMDFSEKMRMVMGKTDPALFMKAKNALIDGKETIRNITADIVAENPEFLLQQLRHLSVLRNSKTRILKRKIELVEDLPDDSAIEALEKGISACAMYDWAEMVNATSRIANKLHHRNPELLISLLTEFTGSLDLYEIEESVRWMAKDLGRTVRPLARTLFPIVAKEFFGFLTPEDDGQDEAIQEAREMIRRFILNEETLS